MAKLDGHPWTGLARRFVVQAMPSGDRINHVPGPIVALREHYQSGMRERLYSRAEAEQLRDELSRALRALDLGEAMTDVPRAYLGEYPIRSARTLGDIELDDQRRAAPRGHAPEPQRAQLCCASSEDAGPDGPAQGNFQ